MEKTTLKPYRICWKIFSAPEKSFGGFSNYTVILNFKTKTTQVNWKFFFRLGRE